jgi:hypothetical protein
MPAVRLRRLSERDRDGLGPAAHAELGRHTADVMLGGVGADDETLGDRRVREAVGRG